MDYVRRFYLSLAGVGACITLFIQTLYASLKRPPSWNLILDQLYHIGVLSLPVVAITGVATGMVLTAQAFYQLGDKGLSSATGLLVGKSMLTEIGPALTAFMVTGRVGSSICAVIGTMRVTEQVDALKSMAVNPLTYLVAPRIFGCITMLPLLTIFSAILGIYGGYMISATAFGMSYRGYFDPMVIHITYFDFWTGIIKAAVFGFLISTIACYKGLTTTGGALGVGHAITSCVVVSYSYILVINFLMTMGLNILHQLFVESTLL